MIKLVTPSGDLAMNTGNSAVRTQNYGQNEVQQSNASALAMHAEVQQLAASALKGTMEVFQATGSALTMHGEIQQLTASALNTQAVGATASGAADAGNPIKVGGHSYTASPTQAATGDRVDAYFDAVGRLMVRSGEQGQDQWTATCAPVNGALRAVAVQAAAAANVRNVCNGFVAAIASGSGVQNGGSFLLQLRDGTEAGTVLFTMWMSAGTSIGNMTSVALNNLWIKSTNASALTMMFTNAPGANQVQSISLWGTRVFEP